MHLTVCCRFLICCVGGGELCGKVSGTYDPVFRVIKYGPWMGAASGIKAPIRFEFMISCLLDRRFNQLSHGGSQ